MATQSPVSEDQLIEAAQLGQEQAFQALVTAYEAIVLGFLYRLGHDIETAQDLAQDTFLKAWLALEKYSHRQKFKSWLLRIAYNTSADFWRCQRPTVVFDTVTLADPQLGLEDQVSRNQGATLIKQVVQSLPEQSRAVLILREYHQFSYKEIAQTLDIPPGTVISRLNYARSTLKKRLQPLLERIDA